MPLSMSLANSAFALANFYGDGRRARAETERPSVMMRCVTPWRTGKPLALSQDLIVRVFAC